MNTIEPTPDIRPEPVCPTCGRPSAGVSTNRHQGVVTANHICARGHLWLTRWLAVA